MSVTAAAEPPVRPSCSSARHPHHAVAQRAARRTAMARRSVSLVGEKHQLVILVDFSDRFFKDEDPLTLWNGIFNEQGLRTAPFYGSVYDYFHDQSYGQLRLHFDLHYVRLPGSYALYGSKGLDDTPSGQMLMDLLDVMRHEVADWSLYDWDDDGYVDQVLMLFAGKGQNWGGDSKSIWAHYWSLTEQGRTAYAVSDRYQVDAYGVFPELSNVGDYGSFGTLCHEYGHCLGLPDFYYGSSTYVVGSWDIMDVGNYNMGGFCPPGYSAHERMFLGWLTPVELTVPTTVSGLAELGTSQQAYLIRNDGYADEFYVVENRQQTGWDQSLPGSGLLVFHVDYDETVWREGIPNTSSLKRYTIFPANGYSGTDMASGWAYPYGDNRSLTDESVPAATLLHNNASGQRLMGKPLTDMVVKDGVASFKFMGGAPTAILSPSLTSAPEKLYRYGPLYIVRNARGETKKVMRR